MATILVVDDRAVGRELLVTLLGYYHHRLLEASDGEEALKIIAKDTPDLIITDILMPKMGGYELVKKMQADPRLKDLPVIFYTGAYRVGDAALLAVNCGVKHVLSKPSDPQLILDTVNKVLGEIKSEQQKKSLLSPSLSQSNQDEGEFQVQGKMLEYSSRVEEIKKALASLLMQAKNKPSIEVTETLALNIDLLIKMNSLFLGLFDLFATLNRGRDQKKLIQLFCKKACELLEAKSCVLGILDPKLLKLRYYFELNQMELPLEFVDFKSYQCDFITKLINSSSPLKINNIKEAVSSELPRSPSIEACLFGVPLIYEERTYGFVYFADRSQGELFSTADLEVASVLASQFSNLFWNLEFKKNLKEYLSKPINTN